MFGLCKGEMSMEDIDIVDAIITDLGVLRLQPSGAML